MKKILAQFLSLVMMLQLIVTTVPEAGLGFTALAQANSCTQGLVWNDMLGRCLTSEQVSKMQAANNECMKLGTPEAQKKCFLDVIEGKLTDAEGSGEIGGAGKVSQSMVSVIIAMAGLAAGVTFLATGKAASCPTAYSGFAIAGGATAVLAGEILSANQYKSKMKEVQEDLKKIADSSASSTSDNATATNTQAEVFDALIKREQAVISAGKMKKNLYLIAKLAYTAAVALAVFEMLPWNAATSNCVGSAPANPYQLDPKTIASSESSLVDIYLDNVFNKNQMISFQEFSPNFRRYEDGLAGILVSSLEHQRMLAGGNSSLSIDEYENVLRAEKIVVPEKNIEERRFIVQTKQILNQLLIPSAYAGGLMSSLPMLGATVGGGAAAGMLLAKSKVLESLFKTPYTRIALAGIMLASSLFMGGHIGKEIDKATKRKEFLEKLKQQVTASGAAFSCTSTDRNDYTKPNCYCYSESGTLNPQRSASQTCKNLFASTPNGVATGGTNGGGPGTGSPTSCMTNQGAFDGSCSCKATKTCASIPSWSGSSIPGIVMGDLPNSVINPLLGGTLSPGDVNTGGQSGVGARAKQLQDKILKDPKNKAIAAKVKKAEEEGKKLMANMASSIGNTPGLANAAGFGDTSVGSTNDLEKMKDDLKQEINRINGPTATSSAAAGGKAANDEFSLDSLNASQGGVQIEDEKMAELMASQLDMGNSDINTNPGANIFQILSNRYQRSGMRRLFGGEALVPADKPNETDIAK